MKRMTRRSGGVKASSSPARREATETQAPLHGSSPARRDAAETQAPLHGSSWPYVALNLFFGHMFILPPLLVLAGAYGLCTGSAFTRAAILVTLALYISSTMDGAPRTGARYKASVLSFFLPCHSYFPVRTLLALPDGSFSSVPQPGHDAVYRADKAYVFAAHPHGAIPVSAAVLPVQLSRWPGLSSRLRIAVASVLFYVPIVREIYLWFGAVDAHKATLTRLLQRGTSVVILPGGIAEQLLICPEGHDLVVLANRRGFVRLALETGASLVPVYCFGERRVYEVHATLTKYLSRFLKRVLGIGLPIVTGRWWTLMPYPRPLTIVVGKPLVLPHIASPDEATVAHWHGAYVAALQSLHDAHKAAAGFPDDKLIIK